MKLTDVVAKHGFSPSDLGQIDNAKLYERDAGNALSELLCVQKIGNIMKVNRVTIMIAQGPDGKPMILPIGSAVDKIIPKGDLENYLNTTLGIPQDAQASSPFGGFDFSNFAF